MSWRWRELIQLFVVHCLNLIIMDVHFHLKNNMHIWYLLLAIAAAQTSRICPQVSGFCVTAQLSASDVCFTIHSKESGWAALGISKTGMPNAEIYAGWKNSSNQYTVASLQTGSSRNRPTLQTSQLATPLPAFDAAPSWAKTTFAFCRPLNAGRSIDANQGYIFASSDTPPTGDINSPSASIPYHSNNGVFSFDFTKTGSGVSGPNIGGPVLKPTDGFTIKSVYLLHGSLMWVAWIICPFVGIFIARYMKSSLGHNWFRLHVLIMGVLCICLTLASFLLIVLYRATHFNSFHTILGIIITLGCVGQGILGYISDKKFTPDRPNIPWWDKLHWWAGRVLWILGIINVFLGMKNYEQNGFVLESYVVIVHWIIVGFGFALMIYGQIKFGQDNHVASQLDENSQ
jgi:hypothetical protein